MKKIIFLSCLLVALGAKAQFFQHLYGTSGSEYVGNGVNTNATGMGHFITSPSNSGSVATTGLLATNTDVNGNILAFNNTYFLTHASGVAIAPQNTLPIEFSNGSGFGVFGMFYDQTGSGVQSGVYYLELDNAGTVVNTTQYDPVSIPGGTAYVVEVAAVTETQAGGEFYITGTVDPAVPSLNGSFWIFVIKIDQAGNIIWSVIYDIANPGFNSSRDWAKDIIESPYTPAGVTEVVVVGQTYGNGGSSDAFFLRMDASNGNMLGLPFIYGTTTTFESFYSIDVANSTAGGLTGFIIGGDCDIAGSWDYWVVKVEPRGRIVTLPSGVLWSFVYDYNGGSGNFDHCTDIIERLNTNGLYEYFVGGNTNTGNIGGTDLVVQKIDDMGVPYGLGQFTYGSSIDESGTYLDQYNGTGSDGLSVFGSFNTGSDVEAYHVKAYFNGYSGCNEQLDNTTANAGPKIIAQYKTKLYSNFTNSTISAGPGGASDNQLCYNTSIGGGSNARIAPAKTGDDAVIVSPNPAQTGTALVNVELESETPTEVSVAIYDMLGREYYNSKFTLAKGKNRLPLDISSAGMAAGMYNIRITEAANSRNMLLMVR